ncbi:MAG: rhomboid family intramembrane serine protease [Xanthomonadales bacterium]|nr:rhomboid family intramembrane serine protease [Xanthomonadales bacterium]
MFPRLLPVTRALLMANVAVYRLQLVSGNALMDWLALWPLGYGFMPWQLLTYGFLHDTGGIGHLAFNMLTLYSFGMLMERYFTASIGAICAGLIQLMRVASCRKERLARSKR